MNLDIIKIEVLGNEVEFSFRPHSDTDFLVIRQILLNHSYSMDNIAHAKSVQRYYENLLANKKKPIIIDAGANIGAASVWFSLAYQASLILAIEPEIHNISVLKANVKKKNIKVIEGAVDARSGESLLDDPGLGDWAFRLSDDGNGYPIQTFALNELLDGITGTAPFICKIDIEGAEKRLFNENTEWVKLFPIIIVELHDWMYPGQAVSKDFYNIISNGNYDVINRGELTFALNNDLLRQYY